MLLVDYVLKSYQFCAKYLTFMSRKNAYTVIDVLNVVHVKEKHSINVSHSKDLSNLAMIALALSINDLSFVSMMRLKCTFRNVHSAARRKQMEVEMVLY